MKRKRKKKQRNRQHMQKLRAKFMAQAKKYFGTPYAKRYWTPDGMRIIYNYNFSHLIKSCSTLHFPLNYKRTFVKKKNIGNLN